MKVLVWNVRGMNDPLKQKLVVDRIRNLKINVVCLLETRVKEHNMKAIHNRHFQGWSMAHNYTNNACNGRIWVLWRGPVQVDIVDTMEQCISCGVTFGMQKFYLSAVYGFNEGIDRRQLWSHLISLKGSFSQHPWLVAGDFNVIAQAFESSNFDGSQGLNLNSREFIECLQTIAIFDHASIGPLFTWSNKQDDGFLAKKLDRVLINDEWSISFPRTRVEFLAPEISDHCPAFLQLENKSYSPPKPFKFFNYWVRHPEFKVTIENSWNQHVTGTPMVILQRKLKRLKQSLKDFNKVFYADISTKVKAKRDELAGIQGTLLDNPNRNDLVQLERKLIHELYELVIAEESLFKQKSRIQWLKERDSNTTFFHKMVAAKQSRNTISSLLNSEGRRLNSYQELADEAVSFFQKLIGTKDAGVSGCPYHILEELYTTVLTDEAQTELAKPITPEEVKAAIFSIGDDKASGPDGFTAYFFKSSWSIVGGDVTAAILYFFQTSSLLPAFNSTIVALVPKCQNPNSMRDFRPISCCSVVYKSITKILARRLQKFLPSIIGRSQCAFIGGRSISDNIFMAQELVKGYGRTTLSPRCAIKIDIQKAFDSLNWDFVLDTLTVLRTSPIFISWIRSCLTSPILNLLKWRVDWLF